MTLPPRPCPLCGVSSQGFPVWDSLCETEHACEWPENVSWAFRLDLRGWICAACDIEVGIDKYRASLSAAYRERYEERRCEIIYGYAPFHIKRIR